MLPQRTSNVKASYCREGGELDMTETLVIIAVTVATLNIMKIIEVLDTPGQNRRQA